jgi:bifunctional DNase/RNase
VAIRLGEVPIFVDEDLFERVSIDLGDVDEESGEGGVDPEEEVRQFRAFLEDLAPDDFLES